MFFISNRARNIFTRKLVFCGIRHNRDADFVWKKIWNQFTLDSWNNIYNKCKEIYILWVSWKLLIKWFNDVFRMKMVWYSLFAIMKFDIPDFQLSKSIMQGSDRNLLNIDGRKMCKSEDKYKRYIFANLRKNEWKTTKFWANWNTKSCEILTST